METIYALVAVNIFIGLIAICQRQITIHYLSKGGKNNAKS